MYPIQLKRVYEDATEEDGYRVLVDRLWPRGITKERAHLDEWNKSIAPSTALRIWFNHQADHFEIFKEKYTEELTFERKEIERLKRISEEKTLTLVYAAKDPVINHVVILKEIIEKW